MSLFLVRLCRALGQKQVKYALVGGHAVALHGAIRGTIDIDLVIEFSLENVRKTEEVLKDLGLSSYLPLSAEYIFSHRKELIEERNLVAWSFISLNNPLEVVDLIVSFDLNEDMVVEKTLSNGETLKVLSKDELIKMKKASGRPQDLADITALGEES